jgi:type I restriction enzyme S subunit
MIPVPPREEQSVLLDRLRWMLTAANDLEVRAQEVRSLLRSFEASIMAKAFRGDLVPQEPDDEPASVLLKRIRVEHTEKVVTRGSRSRKKEQT